MSMAEKAMEHLKANFADADNILEDEEKLAELIEESKAKAKDLAQTNDGDATAKTFVEMLEDYSIGAYVDIQKDSLLAITGALAYLVDTFDTIPDFIPVAGLSDDAAVVKAALEIAANDVNAYKGWKQS